jgi:hypothetical protein
VYLSESSQKSLINIMKRTLVVLSLVGFVGSSAFAGDCASKACCKTKTASTCPVTKASQQAKGAAGSTKEIARASKTTVMVLSAHSH